LKKWALAMGGTRLTITSFILQGALKKWALAIGGPRLTLSLLLFFKGL